MEQTKRQLRPEFSLCKLELCPSKGKCLRHPAAGIAAPTVDVDRYGPFGLLPGERRCPNFVPLKDAERFLERPEKMPEPEIEDVDLARLHGLRQRVNLYFSSGYQMAIGGSMVFTAEQWIVLVDLFNSRQLLFDLALRGRKEK